MTELSIPNVVPACQLDTSGRKRLEEEFTQIAYDYSVDVEKYLDAAFIATVRALPADVLGPLVGLRKVDSPGSLVVLNLPVDPDVPATPAPTAQGLYDLVPMARAALFGIARVLGEPFGYRGEYDGEMVTHVLPSRLSLDATSSQGSRKPLPFHTEDVHLDPISPDYVALYCVRSDASNRAKTRLAYARDIVRRVPDDLLEILRLPLFFVRSPLSFGQSGVNSGPLPVIRGSRSRPQITAEFTDMVGLTASATSALHAVAEAANQTAVEVELRAGDILLIDNRKTLHGRTAFDPRMDGTDRWLLRTLIRSGDLWDWRLYLDQRQVVL